MNSLILAALLALNPGYNNPGVAGEVLALNAATSNAAATVEVQKVSTLTVYTNIVSEVVSYETAWRVTVTNYNPGPATYALPADCYPVTDPLGTYTTTEVVAPDHDPTILHLKNPDAVPIATFSRSAPYAFIKGTFLGLKFAGADGVPDEWPCLEVIEPPAVYTTNVVGRINYDDFRTPDGRSTIVGEPVRFEMAITNSVVTGQAVAGIYMATNSLATVTTSGHFGTVSTNGFLFGEAILVTGAADGDKVQILTR